MGEAKRRKKLDPNYGKPKPSEFQETIAQVLVLAVLLGIELWRKDNPDANWDAIAEWIESARVVPAR